MTGSGASRTRTSPAVPWPELPGAPETRLARAVADALPYATPCPPWRTRVEATLWWHAAHPGALAALPTAVRPRRDVVVGAVVRYLDSPVGPYEEVLAAVVPGLRGVTVPFLAVDRLASVAGGRAHWALPKATASFATVAGRVTACGHDWTVAADPVPRGPRLPVAGGLRLGQVGPDGRVLRAVVVGWGSARAARVGVDVSSAQDREPGSVAGLLPRGRHPGAVLHARVRIGGPR